MIDDIRECDEYPSVIPDVGSFLKQHKRITNREVEGMEKWLKSLSNEEYTY